MADVQSVRLARQLLASSLFGQQFDGSRDIFESAGYPKNLEFQHFYGRWRRGDLGARIIEAAPIESWSSDPLVLDGPSEKKGKDNTPFAEAVMELSAGRMSYDDEFFGLWSSLRQLDIESGIGQYGGILLGLNDGDDLSAPIRPGGASPVDGLLYATVYNEGNLRILVTDDDPTSRRFGLPEHYEIHTANNRTVRVHWSRVVHAAEGGDIYAIPRLERVYNRLMDLDKVLAGGGESAWRMVVPRYIAAARDDYAINPDNTALSEQIDQFIHDLRNWLDVEGVDVTEFAGAIVDPSPAVQAYTTVISGALGIPTRILMGSERGELASSMDEITWAKRIGERRTNYVSRLIKRTLTRLSHAGVLPAPSSGAMTVQWESLLSLDDNERAEMAERVAKVMVMLGYDVEPEAFVSAFIPMLNPKDVEKPEPEPVPAALEEAGGPVDTEIPEDGEGTEEDAEEDVEAYP